jgi:PAS domain S-box-containing protein
MFVSYRDDGHPLRVVGVNIDITGRKRAEEQLRRLATFNKAALKSLGEGLYTIDIQGLVTFVNPAAEELFGWSFAELRGKKMHDMTHHHYRDGRPFPSCECAGFQVLTHGKPLKDYEDVFIRKDGTFFDVIYTITPLRDDGGQITGLIVVFSDITDRKRAEEALRQSEEQAHEQFAELTNLYQHSKNLLSVVQAIAHQTAEGDEALTAFEVTKQLKEAGFDVIGPAASVTQALRLLQEQSGCDAAVLDVNLGRETSEVVARRLSGCGTPFVTITGYSRMQLAPAFKAAPLLTKPVSSNALVETLRCQLAAHLSCR